MLGRAFRELLLARQRPFTGFDLPGLDIAEPGQVGPLFEQPWSAVINCAAYTNVDGAEADEAAALRANGTAPGIMAAACARTRVPLVHFSTDYVFAGNARTPYPVDAPLQPLGAYGRSKAAGEIAIRQSGAEFLIVRTSWLYAPWGNNFVRTVAHLTRAKPEVNVVNDQRGRPTTRNTWPPPPWLCSTAGSAELCTSLTAANAPGTTSPSKSRACSATPRSSVPAPPPSSPALPSGPHTACGSRADRGHPRPHARLAHEPGQHGRAVGTAVGHPSQSSCVGCSHGELASNSAHNAPSALVAPRAARNCTISLGPSNPSALRACRPYEAQPFACT